MNTIDQPVDRTFEIFEEVYSEEYIDQLVNEMLIKYPFATKWDRNRQESLAVTEERHRRYWSQDSRILSAHLVAQHDDNAAKGWNTD